jgi:hypothetical protein
MKATGALDCLRMKRELQARLHKKWKGLTTEEIQAAIKKDLATSQSDLARWWRQTASLQRKTRR